MKTYEHRQTGSATLIVGALVVIWLIISTIAFGELIWVNVIMLLVAVAVLGMFTTLRTHVDRKSIDAMFTFGFPKRSIPIKDIESHEAVRNKWYYGWGVRKVPGAVMFNVWGLDAVDVTHRKNGKTKTFRIGTDDVDGLRAALDAAIDARPKTG